MTGVQAMVRAAIAVGAGGFIAACAAVSGLDDYNYNPGAPCPWGCDASVRADAADAGQPPPGHEGGDGTLADGPAPPADDGPAADGGPTPDSASNDGGEDGGEDAGDAPEDAPEVGCAAGSLSCDGGCRSPSDPSNCGRCDNVCGAEGGLASCEPLPDNGSFVCVPVCPETAPAVCDGGCVDTTSDPQHCGSCGGACPGGGPNSHPTCGDGGCGFACNAGFSLCDGGCASYTTAGNCGGCGVACDPDGGTPLCAPVGSGDGGTYACSSGCPSSAPSRCAGGCTNTSVDPTNCGGCGQPCTTSVAHATALCSGGACSFTCNSGYTACGGACVDVTTDPSNCGGCGVGHVCGLTQVCLSGACTSRCQKTSDCPTGYSCNGSTCTTACSVSQPCHGGCCQNGTCTNGLAALACGTNGGACVACSAQSTNTACISGVCGCSSATDCASLTACSTALHSCEGLCGGANTGCNGGCCTNLSGGGTCVAGTTDTQCGGTGGQCNDCQSGCNPGPHCVSNACACSTFVDCLGASSCSGRGVCTDAGACHM